MRPERYIMGLFKDDHRAAAAVAALRKSSFKLERVHSPIPSHSIRDALQLKKSKVGLFTLAGGIIGFFTGFALAIFTATKWSLIVSGKPVVALVPFMIVGFEFTVLFAVFGNVIGLLTQTRLPQLPLPEYYDPRCSGEYFGVLASCQMSQTDDLVRIFKENGVEQHVLHDAR